MSHKLLHQPPATHDFRPEKQDVKPGSVESILKSVSGGAERLLRSKFAGLKKILPKIEEHTGILENESDADLKKMATHLGLELRRRGFSDDLVAHVFALVREVSGRTLGKRHFDVQLMGGWALLKGMVAEMETGEGKTLTATLAVSTAALAGGLQ